MAATPESPKIRKRPPPANYQSDGTTTLHASFDPLRSIYVYVDEAKDIAEKQMKQDMRGSVTFVTESGKKIQFRLSRTWFPAGTWNLEMAPGGIKDFSSLYPPNVPDIVIKGIKLHSDSLVWSQTSEEAKKTKLMIDGAAGHSVRLIVFYSKAAGGNAKNASDKQILTGGNINSLLADENLAKLYLQFVEHFGGISVDYTLAQDGLTRQELDIVEQNNPDIIAITDLFLQGYAEFQLVQSSATPPPTIDEFRAMEEAIFFQRKVKNDLALRNLLMIGIGSMFTTDPSGKRSYKTDIGVLRRIINGTRSAQQLMYDRYGNAVRSIVGGYVDTEYRSTNIEAVNRDLGIPLLTISVSDQGLYLFLRSIEQTIGHPIREFEALAVSYYNYSIFINAEIYRRYNGEIGQRIIHCLPIVIAFFVAHAFASYLVAVQPMIGVPLMLLIKGAGMVMGFDAVLLDLSLMTKAGRHFCQMEQLHRESDNDKPKLSGLSESHLKEGAAALLDAMADIIAMGVVIIGAGATAKYGPALITGMKNVAKARLKITIDDNQATKIESIDPMKEIKTPESKSDAENGTLKNPPPDPGLADPPDTKPIDHPDSYKGDPLNGKTPETEPFNPNRPKAIDLAPKDFAKDNAAQVELFERAKEVVPRQNAFIKSILEELGIKDAEAESILKRDDFADFTKKVIEKVTGRKTYTTVGEMTDMVRGRVNLENPADVERVYNAIRLQNKISIGNEKGPGKVAGVENGYPRYHIDVIDPETGISHEWQIGTKQTNSLFQDAGIEPCGLNIKPENTNLHDIEYDIFKSLDEPGKKDPEGNPFTPELHAEFKQLANETGITPFRERLAQFAARTGKEKVLHSELQKQILEFHQEASKILNALVTKKGLPFVQKFIH